MLYVPQTRVYGPSLASLHSLDLDGLDVTVVIDRAGDDPGAHRFENITRKYNRARDMVLADGYDYLATMEDDIIVRDPKSLKMLIDTGYPVAYGLTVWRVGKHHWSATLNTPDDDPDATWLVTLDMLGEVAERRWGGVVETPGGMGQFFSLIRREVLVDIPFRRNGLHCADWYFAQDAKRCGVPQATHTGVVCGHISMEPSPRAYWPIGEPPFYTWEGL